MIAAKRTRPVRFLRSSDYRGHWNYYQYLAARYKARDSTEMLAKDYGCERQRQRAPFIAHVDKDGTIVLMRIQ